MAFDDRTQALLDEARVSYDVEVCTPAATADAAAASAHVPLDRFAKVVIVDSAGGRPLVAVVPASRHVDLPALADVSGLPCLALASETECARLFPDCELGAMPPFGNLYGLPVFVDECLAARADVTFQAGRHSEIVTMRFADFERLSRAVRGEFCR